MLLLEPGLEDPEPVPMPLEPGVEVPDPVEDGELLDPVDDGEPIELPEPEVPYLPLEPFDRMSMVWTCGVSPGPEKLARTCSPSLMSSTEARAPSFVTCVVPGSTFSIFVLPDSVSVLVERSKLWTFPLSALKWPVAVPDSLDAVGDEELPAPMEPVPDPDELPVPMEPVPDPMEELEPEPIDELPIEPLSVEDEPIDPVEPELAPVLPWFDPRDQPVEPVPFPYLSLDASLRVPTCAWAWLATRTMPAAARPKPHPLCFMTSPPVLVPGRDPARAGSCRPVGLSVR